VRAIEPALDELLKSLQGGPIELRPVRLGPGMISRSTAVQKAERYLGVRNPPAHAWCVLVTDGEFLGGWLRERPCWLLEYGTEAAWLRGSEKHTAPALYATVDAETGVCWELFTKPRGAWWESVAFKGADVVRRFHQWGEVSSPSQMPPGIPALRALDIVAQHAKLRTFLMKGRQVIARYFGYTTRNHGIGIRRLDGLEVVPRLLDHGVWFISLEGIDAPWPGPMPRMPSGTERDTRRIQEANAVVDATTGTLLSWGHYR